ncbi:pyridoxal phosphate-dependent aminotransferase [Dinghuibacter silviterrae]|uniref:Aminotransferase n=1 Tax=Dinghuibacter silviterrae TaxID=1539049 RepID=A0A4R8DPB5_9BACT|nr:aminotransferase class I/II-fold pyridoxal phosphate-dependent enzyme [Dinghuibacter silviterrae]TDW99688.1 aspartate aminotransferase [Dinghuibacter silviterrae]
MQLSQLAESLIGSEIVRLGNEIKDKIRQGNRIYNFTIGDFDSRIFPIPQELEKGIIEAYREGYTNYPPAEGILELRESVGRFLADREGLHYTPSEILIASGGRPLIYALYRAIVDKGEKVIYAVPSWNNNHYVHFVGGQHVTIDTTPEQQFMPTADQVRPLLGDATLLALCSPQNPTGTAFSKEELQKICDAVVEENARRGPGKKKLFLLYDQMYWTLTYGKTRHYNPVSLRPELKDYTVFIDGISKVFAATGLRVGWALGPAEIIAKMKAILSHMGAWAPMAEQRATAAYLGQTEAIDRYLKHFKNELEERLNRIYDGFRTLKTEGFAVDSVEPQAALYLTVCFDLTGKKTPAGKVLEDQEQVTAYILDAAGLAVVPFSAFGAGKNSPWYRLSVGTCVKEEIPDMLGAVRKALEGLR